MKRHFAYLDDLSHGRCDLPDAVTETYLEPVFDCARESASLLANRVTVSIGDVLYELPKFLLLGERGGGVPIRLGLYAGLDADRLDTVIAASRLLLQLELSPILAQDYAVFASPVVNLAGFGWEKAPLVQFQKRYARGAADGDVRYFQTDFAKWKHDGLIFLRSTGMNTAFSATVRSQVMADEVVGPALETIASFVPLARRPVRVLPESAVARFADFNAGRLLPPPDRRPWPFEIELHAPSSVDCELRVRSLFIAVIEILRRYRQFIAHAGEL
jgi:hypothetical protein